MYNPSPLASDATSSFRRCRQAGRLRWLPWEAACDSLKYKKFIKKISISNLKEKICITNYYPHSRGPKVARKPLETCKDVLYYIYNIYILYYYIKTF